MPLRSQKMRLIIFWIFWVSVHVAEMRLTVNCESNSSYYITTDCPYLSLHGDIIEYKYFQHYWPFVRGIHRSFEVFFDLHPNKRLSKQSRRCGDLRCHPAHYDVTGAWHIFRAAGYCETYTIVKRKWLFPNLILSTTIRLISIFQSVLKSHVY